MLKTNLSLLVVAASCIFLAYSSAAGPLSSAEVTKIINRVSVVDPVKGGHIAMIREVIKDDLGLRTGAQSRSELLFQDNTLTRIGAETFFSFKTGTRDMTLEKGSMLLQVPKALGGAKIHTAAVTAAITGTTIMMEHIPGRYIKVLVLEGSLRLSRNGTFGDSLLLRPGKMVIMRPDAKKIPDPIDVDLEQIVKTSTLVNFPGEAPLPSMLLIQAAIDEQKKQLAKSDLVPTNLVMGHGTNVIFASGDLLAKTIRPISFSGVNSNGGPVAGLKGGTVGLPIVGSVANTATSGTTAMNNLLGSGGNTLTSGTTAVNNLLGSGGNTLTSTTTAVNNLLGSSGNTLTSATTAVNNLLGSSGTAVSVSSSTQILGLLNNVAPTSGGIITITPAVAHVGATVAAVPAGVVQPNIAAGTVNATGTVPILNGPTPTLPAPANVLAAVVSAPTTPTTGVPLSLRGGR